jgi:hypothetical protein
MDIHQT